jgi:hypothetical protein
MCMTVLVIPAPSAIVNGLRHRWILFCSLGKEDAEPSSDGYDLAASLLGLSSFTE